MLVLKAQWGSGDGDDLQLGCRSGVLFTYLCTLKKMSSNFSGKISVNIQLGRLDDTLKIAYI